MGTTDTSGMAAKLITNRVLAHLAPQMDTMNANMTTMADDIRTTRDALLALGGEIARLQDEVATLKATPTPEPEPKRPEIKRRPMPNPPFPPGEQHPSAKLTEQQVMEIIALRENGFTGREIATAFGVSESNIYLITSGRGWKHIPRRHTDGTVANG